MEFEIEFKFNYDPEIETELELDAFLEYTSTDESDIIGIYESIYKFQE
jgi:hypothetical protein